MADGDRRTAATCQHCHTPIIRDPGGQWLHTSLKYACTDPWGAALPTSAEPAPAPEPVEMQSTDDDDEYMRAVRARENAYQRQHRRQATGLPAGDPRHGKISGYMWHGCRCDACTAAKRAHDRRYPVRSRSRRALCGCDTCRARRAGRHHSDGPAGP